MKLVGESTHCDWRNVDAVDRRVWHAPQDHVNNSTATVKLYSHCVGLRQELYNPVRSDIYCSATVMFRNGADKRTVFNFKKYNSKKYYLIHLMLCLTGWRCSLLSFCLFQINFQTNSAVIFPRKLFNPSNCIHHFCHPLVTLKSHLGLEEQPRILDPVTVLTATNLSFITPS